MTKATSLLGAFLLMLAPVALAENSASEPNGSVHFDHSANDTVIVTVDWCHKARDAAIKAGTTPLPVCKDFTAGESEKIQAAETVLVKVQAFNFIRYSIERSVETEECESCKLLERLWGGIFSLTTFDFTALLPSTIAAMSGNAAKDGQNFLAAYKAWRREIESVKECLKTETKRYQKPFLEKGAFAAGDDAHSCADGESRGLDGSVKVLKEQRNRIEKARQAAWVYAKHLPLIEAYDRLEAGAHSTALAAVDSFIALAQLSLNGETQPVREKVKANTFVTVTLEAKLRGATPDEPVDASNIETIKYFVASKLPLIVHLGAAVNFFDDTEFEKVRTVAGDDAFALVGNEDFRAGLTAFLSYELVTFKEGRVVNGVSFTLGTGFEDPGDTIYVGGTLRIKKRFALTGGFAFGKVKMPGEMVTMSSGGNGDGSNANDQSDLEFLFETFQEERKGTGFLAFSIMLPGF